MNVTIKDIAKIAGVSHSTVSRALNNHSGVNKETKDKIFKIAKELNYTPNISARNLVLAKSNNIGVFFSSIHYGTSPSFFYNIIKTIAKEVVNEYSIIVNAIDTYVPNSINPRNYDGIILVSQKNTDDDFIREVLEKEIPIVVLNREVSYLNVSNIISDEASGVYEGINYLINKGHEKIAIMEGVENFESTKKRKEGYIKAFKEKNISIHEEYIVKGEFSLASGYLGAKKLLRLKDRPSAIFAFNDDMAIGAIKAITEEKLRVPEDISVMGFDGSEFSIYLNPAITTVERPIDEMCRYGVKILIETIESKKKDIERKCFNTSLIEGNSILETKYVNKEF